MGIAFHYIADQGEPGPGLVADRALYLTEDKMTLVEERDERARFVLTGPGGTVPQAEVDRLGLAVVDGRVVQTSAAPDSFSGTVSAEVPAAPAPDAPPSDGSSSSSDSDAGASS